MEQSFHRTLIKTYRCHCAKCRIEFQKLNLSEGQPKILMHLLSGNGMLQKDLSEVCHVQPATMTSLLKNMVTADLVLKKEIHVSGGKRGYLIFLTDHGKDLAYQVVEILDRMEKLSFQGFTEKEREQLTSYLTRICNNLE